MTPISSIPTTTSSANMIIVTADGLDLGTVANVETII
jgi:hypothetical protein